MSDKFVEDGEGLEVENPAVEIVRPGDEGHIDDSDGTFGKVAEAGEPDDEHQDLTEDQLDAFRVLSPERPQAEEARAALQRTLERALARQGRRVAGAVRGRLETIEKAAGTQPRDKAGRWASTGGGSLLAGMDTEVLENGLSDETTMNLSPSERRAIFAKEGFTDEEFEALSEWQKKTSVSTEESMKAGEEMELSAANNGRLYQSLELQSRLEQEVFETRFSEKARTARFEREMRSNVWESDVGGKSMDQVADALEKEGKYDLAGQARNGPPPPPKLYRGGSTGEKTIESWTRDPRGANTGGAGRIKPDHSMSVASALSGGYLIAGGFTRAMGAPGEMEVTLVRIQGRKPKRIGKAIEPEITAAEAVATAAALAALEDEIIEVALESLGSWDFVISSVGEVLEEVAQDAVQQAVAVIGVDSVDDLFEQVSERSVRMAQERAAELVGRRVLADGSIIDNPSAQWAISQSTRDQIKATIERVIRSNAGSDALIEALEQDHAFSPARAEMVSRTEIADINSRAQMETYHTAAEAGVEVRKRWVLGPRPCVTCRENAAQGAIPLDESFPSGDDTAPAHPNCVCAVVPEVE